MRLVTNPVGADAERWDPADQEPFRRITGEQFLRVDGETAVVRTEEGREQVVHPGWYAVRPDGARAAFILSAEHVGDETRTWRAA